jgi:hypothetical protein
VIDTRGSRAARCGNADLPLRPHDQRQTIARGPFFCGHQRHFMIDRDPIQLARSKTRGCRVPAAVLSHSMQNPFSSAKHPAFCLGRARRTPNSTAHDARYYLYLQHVLWTSTPTHQSKPIADALCSGLVQSTFRSPPWLRSGSRSAYVYSRRAPT